MSSNVTQFPLTEEYIRVFPVIDVSDGTIQGCMSYPIRQFKVPQDEMSEVFKNAVLEINKTHSDGESELIVQLLNQFINAGVEQIINEGRGSSAEKFNDLLINDMNDVFDNMPVVATCDGYFVFNPGIIPPSPSPHRH